MLQEWVDAMDMANEATYNSAGYADELQEKYENSFNGRLEKLKATSDEFWINFLDNDTTSSIITNITSIIEALTNLTDMISPLGVALGAFGGGKLLQSLFTGKFNIGDKIFSALG